MTVNTMATLIEELQIAHEQLVGGLRDTFEAALTIGRLLCEQKTQLPHGQFLPWLKKNVDFISESTCQRCMRLHRNREFLKSVNVTDLTSAYRLLAAPRNAENDSGLVDDDIVVADIVPDDTPVPDDPVVDDEQQPPIQLVEEARRVTPFEAKMEIDESKLTGDSFNLQQLKHYWKRSSKADKRSFREWLGVGTIR
jgi:hypothetical protein